MNTSLKAYGNKKPTIPSDQNLILSVLDEEKGLTYKEIGYKVYKKLLLNIETSKQAYSWKYDPNKSSRRTSELIRQDKIKVLEQRKCSIAKSLCNSYVKI